MELSNRIIYLLHQYVKHQLSAAERTELDAWANQHPENRQLLVEIENETILNSDLQAFHHVYGTNEFESLQRMRNRIRKSIKQAENRHQKTSIKAWLPYLAASIILIFLIVGGYRYWHDIQVQHAPSSLFGGDVLPGENRATLTLADGSRVDLSTEQGEVIIGEEVKYGNGTPVVGHQQEKTGSNLMAISTPKGGQYRITLPDGTTVWLNAATTLRYPQRFSGKERKVELDGEAYFEVKQQHTGHAGAKIPFVVKTAQQTVEVLGTAFNLSAYTDEETVKTTLVNGAVRVSTPAQNGQKDLPVLLKPGEQSDLQNGRYRLSKVNLMSFIGWKEGIFYFNETPFIDAMNQLSRWYDVEVVYQRQKPTTYFYGEISRNKPLAAVLEILQEGGVTFKIERQGEKNKLFVY